MDNHMRNAVMTFVQKIKQSEIYQEYCSQLGRIKEQPELYDKVNEFRKKNFDIQNSEPPETMMERMEDLEREYAWLRENVIVEDFLQAELALCRLMQELDALVVRELDFQ